jgi:hypothetical protein
MGVGRHPFIGAIDQLGHCERFMAIDETLSKGASLVEAPHEKGTPLNRGNIAPAKALIEQVALKGRNDPLEGRTTPWIIAKFKVNLPLAVRCQNLQPDIPEHAGDVMGALAIGQGAVIVTPQVQEASDIAADVSQPLRTWPLITSRFHVPSGTAR